MLRLLGQNLAPTGPQSDGTVLLPGWARLERATAGCTSQQSASTVQSGYAENAPRWFSGDGSSGGLLLEPKRKNLFDNFDYSTAWTLTNNATITYPFADPAGGTEGVRVIDDSGVDQEYIRGNSSKSSPGGDITHSVWMRQNGSGGLASSRVVDDGGFATDLVVNASDVDSWGHGVATAIAEPASALLQVRLYPRVSNADTGTADFAFPQIEAGLYGTSFIDGERAPDRLIAVPEALAPNGRLDDVLVWTPHYAHDEASQDHVLAWLRPDTHVVYSSTAHTVTLTVNGEALVSSALTFSRYQQLRLVVESTATRRRLRVIGATTGDSAVVGDALAPILLDEPQAFLLGGPDGTQEAATLQLVPDGPDFCELVEDRMLSQMSRESPHTNFVDLLCILSEQPARLRDVGLAMLDAFDVDTAIGKQLDTIGSIVGLAREGFPDARYRDFLKIQIELLLSVARDDAEWTGTCENILRIARTFIGETPGESVVLSNAPPYDYLLSVPQLDLDEAFLLVRFLRVASYAGVRGVVLAIPNDGTVWDSDSVSVTNGGVWDSASVAVSGALTWSSVVSTS